MLDKRFAVNATVIVFLVLFAIFAFQPLVYAQQGIELQLQGKALETDPFPFFLNNRIMIPIRDVANNLEVEVTWDGHKGEVIATKKDGQIAVIVGKDQGIINGENVKLDAAPVIVNGRVMVPVRVFAEFCGLSVSWNKTSRVVSLSKKPLVAGSSLYFPPFEFKEGDEIIGFDIDLIRAIEEHMDQDIIVKDVRFDQLLPSLEAGEVDMVVSQLTITEMRKEYFNFSDPYFEFGEVIVTAKGSAANLTHKDLAGKRVAFQGGTYSETFAMAIQEEFPSTKALAYDTMEQVLEAVEEGRADAAFAPYAFTAYYLSKQGNDKLQISSELLTSELSGIAVSKDNPELLDRLNKSLETIKEEGTYQLIHEKWFGTF